MKIYILILVLMLTSRMVEMYQSRKNEKKLVQNTKVELIHPYEHLFVYLFHTLWFLVLCIEAYTIHHLQSGVLSLVCYSILIFAQILRFESMKTLGHFWTTKIYRIDKSHVIKRGVYKYFAHPSYLAVMMEFVALPLLFHAYYTLIIFSILNILILGNRMRMEYQTTGRLI